MRRLVIVLVALAILGGAAWAVNAFFRNKADAAQKDNSVEIAVGETYEISLESNATTGFKWVATFDDKVLELADEQYKEPASGALGAAGTQVFVFKGLAKGETKVTFEYKRPWETVPAEQSVDYSFTVK